MSQDNPAPTLTLQFKSWTAAQAEILLDMMQDFYAFFGYPFDREDKRRILFELAANPHYGELWLIHHNGHPDAIGYFVLACGFSFEYGGKDAFLDELYLRPDFRGRGFGTTVLEFVAERARAIGIRCLHLEVERYNEAGQVIYRRFGFDDQGRLLLSKWL